MYKRIELDRISSLVLRQDYAFDYAIYYNKHENIFHKLIEENDYFSNSVKSLVAEEKIDHFYVKKEDRFKYKDDIQEYLTSIIKDDAVRTEEKAELIYNLAYESLTDLFENDVTEQKINKVSSNIDNTIHLLKSDANALKLLLDVNTYDFYTYAHCIDVATYAIAFGIYLNLPSDDLMTLGKAAIFHDLGKKNIDYEIVTKDSVLSSEEYEVIKSHPKYSVDMLKEIESVEASLLMVIEQHHEKLNGTGYPYGLQNEQIHYLAKILSIVDIFNALTTVRSYKDALSSVQAFELMFKSMKDEICFSYLEKFVCFMGDFK